MLYATIAVAEAQLAVYDGFIAVRGQIERLADRK